MRNNSLSTKDRRGGMYWKDGKPYISITTVLSIIDKPQLRYWFGREVYLAMVVDPTLSEQTALAAPYKKNEVAKARGTLVHSLIEVYKTTGHAVTQIPEMKGYMTAFNSWIKDLGVEVLDQERTIISEKHGIAGTCDLLVKIKGRDGIWVVDAKTGKDLYPEHRLQVSAYKHVLIENGEKVEHIGGLLLKPDGTYMFEEGNDCFKVFLNALELYKWKVEETLEKVGYYNKPKEA